MSAVTEKPLPDQIPRSAIVQKAPDTAPTTQKTSTAANVCFNLIDIARNLFCIPLHLVKGVLSIPAQGIVKLSDATGLSWVFKKTGITSFSNKTIDFANKHFSTRWNHWGLGKPSTLTEGGAYRNLIKAYAESLTIIADVKYVTTRPEGGGRVEAFFQKTGNFLGLTKSSNLADLSLNNERDSYNYHAKIKFAMDLKNTSDGKTDLLKKLFDKILNRNSKVEDHSLEQDNASEVGSRDWAHSESIDSRENRAPDIDCIFEDNYYDSVILPFLDGTPTLRGSVSVDAPVDPTYFNELLTTNLPDSSNPAIRNTKDTPNDRSSFTMFCRNSLVLRPNRATD